MSAGYAPATAGRLRGMSVFERTLSRTAAFWLLACLLGSFLFAASAPSPLYSVYQAMWQFSPSTLTLIYAVYAFGALAALLITGRVSDHAGRRRITAVALVVQVAGMLAFIAAQGVEWLYAARVLQGGWDRDGHGRNQRLAARPTTP